jgi:hypothetical protein
MRKFIKAVLRFVFEKSYRTSISKSVRIALHAFEKEMGQKQREAEKKVIETLSPELFVLDGPFKGLKYPFWKSAGAAFSPKILGTYEKELHPTFYRIFKNNYTDIVNVGAAEGYYAVGLALRCPLSRITAFDIDEDAQKLLKEMARANGVEDRISVEGFCDTKRLCEMEVRSKGLIISDCEGFEVELFKEPFLGVSDRYDLMIETHDSLKMNITKELMKRFNKTHIIEIIKGKKRGVKDFRFAGDFSGFEKTVVIEEWRHRTPIWLFLTSKKYS